MRLGDARFLAQALRDELRSACSRIEIAGSIRRRCPWVNDIELVAIPSAEVRPIGGQVGLFGDDGPTETVNLLWERVEQLGRQRVVPIRPGGLVSDPDTAWPTKRLAGESRYFRLYLPKPRIKVDLFLATPETWGVLYLIRTGSRDFSKAVVGSWRIKSDGGQCLKGRLHPPCTRAIPVAVSRDGVPLGPPIDTPEEEDVFAACGYQWIEPHLRSTGADLVPLPPLPPSPAAAAQLETRHG